MRIGGSEADATDAGSRRRCARVEFANEIRAEGATDVVLLGMGGSSLAPEVMRSIIGRPQVYPALHVVDSTDPAQILSVERAIDFRRTIFLVASKSGTTLEVNILKQHFFHRAVQELGEPRQPSFVLTTILARISILWRSRKFARFFQTPTVGGRYRALDFGWSRPRAGSSVLLLDHRGVWLNAVSPRSETRLARCGLGDWRGWRDKPTRARLASPAGGWLEQLVANQSVRPEGIIPIEAMRRGPRRLWERSHSHLRSAGAPDAALTRQWSTRSRGPPVVRSSGDRSRLRGIYRWIRDCVAGPSRCNLSTADVEAQDRYAAIDGEY